MFLFSVITGENRGKEHGNEVAEVTGEGIVSREWGIYVGGKKGDIMDIHLTIFVYEKREMRERVGREYL